MIDKINGNGAYGLTGKGSQKKNQAAQAYENTPGVNDRPKKKTGAVRNAGRTGAQAHSLDNQGVILDISSKPAQLQTAGKQEKKNSLADTLRHIFAPIVQWFKDFWGSDVSSTNPNRIENIAPDAGLPFVEELGELPPLDNDGGVPSLEKLPADFAKNHSLQQIEQMLTQNGTKRLAHNSDLLTYYDRRGKLVDLDETEKYRVLFGDKNVLKL